jgi:hypothetical protein
VCVCVCVVTMPAQLGVLLIVTSDLLDHVLLAVVLTVRTVLSQSTINHPNEDILTCPV